MRYALEERRLIEQYDGLDDELWSKLEAARRVVRGLSLPGRGSSGPSQENKPEIRVDNNFRRTHLRLPDHVMAKLARLQQETRMATTLLFAPHCFPDRCQAVA
jgi:hypothetical protein